MAQGRQVKSGLEGITSSGSQDWELEKHAREVNTTKPRYRGQGREGKIDLAAASGRTRTSGSTCASTCASTRTCPQTRVGKYLCSRKYLHKYVCKYLREYTYLPANTCRRVRALAQKLVQVRVQVLARAQVLAHKYVSASTSRQVLATRTWRLLVSCRSPRVPRSAFGTLAHKIGGLGTTRAKSTSRSQDREAKAARAISRDALSYLAAAPGRASTSTCASTCASIGTCPQVIVGK
jgi:hypothetical protein